jgi:hypothetical protein
MILLFLCQKLFVLSAIERIWLTIVWFYGRIFKANIYTQFITYLR